MDRHNSPDDIFSHLLDIAALREDITASPVNLPALMVIDNSNFTIAKEQCRWENYQEDGVLDDDDDEYV